MTVQTHDTITSTPANRRANRPVRRTDAGMVQLSQRDIDGLMLTGEHYGAPADLLATALRVTPDRFAAIAARWRRAGYVAAGRLGPGPRWCWLTRDGMAATGLGFPAGRPALGRLTHIRAVLAARLWIAASPARAASPRCRRTARASSRRGSIPAGSTGRPPTHRASTARLRSVRASSHPVSTASTSTAQPRSSSRTRTASTRPAAARPGPMAPAALGVPAGSTAGPARTAPAASSTRTGPRWSTRSAR